MEVQQNFSLKKFNTFGIDAKARYFAAFTSVDELQALLQSPYALGKKLVLGGGSNILLTNDFDGFILKNELAGITLIKEDETFYYVQAAAGENWHRLVMYCVEHNYAGMENLSLIPGNVGASPMQNIGAYGVEIKDIFYSLEAYDTEDKTIIIFTAADCEFGYRESVFKHKYKGRFIILSVTFKLHKLPVYHTSYGAVSNELEKMGVQEPSIQAIANAVINIRQSKLPNPRQIGNAGSFFKNPVIPDKQYQQLKQHYPLIIGFGTGNDTTKLAAGWLIEQCGWKGYRKGDAGCYNKQALVLVNYGNASGREIFILSEQIIQSVEQKFGITLEREVNIW